MRLVPDLRPSGSSVCAAHVSAPDVAMAIEEGVPGEDALALAPSDTTGWFGGTALTAWGVVESYDDLTLEEAARRLERVEEGSRTTVAAALVTYEGAATVRVFGGGLVRAPDGWRLWGEAPAADEVLSRAIDAATHSASRAPGSPRGPGCADTESLVRGATSGMSPAAYRAAVEHTRAEIAAGNVYVANVTYRITGTPTCAPAAAFRVLCDRAAAPMAALFATQSGAIASASPERFLGIERTDDGSRVAEIWPIKGTRPRGSDPAEDRRLALELLGDEKERAEHVMIVDLERNDLGRVCETGTVHVDPLMEVFATPYCHQMVSRVHGILAPKTPLAEVLRAAFPCGSVTGAPKIAAMGLLRGLEGSPRGAYCGALAVASPGRFDSSVLIRTLEYAREEVRWGTGCGITYESDPEREWDESVLKTWPALGD